MSSMQVRFFFPSILPGMEQGTLSPNSISCINELLSESACESVGDGTGPDSGYYLDLNGVAKVLRKASKWIGGDTGSVRGRFLVQYVADMLEQ